MGCFTLLEWSPPLPWQWASEGTIAGGHQAGGGAPASRCLGYPLLPPSPSLLPGANAPPAPPRLGLNAIMLEMRHLEQSCQQDHNPCIVYELIFPFKNHAHRHSNPQLWQPPSPKRMLMITQISMDRCTLHYKAANSYNWCLQHSRHHTCSHQQSVAMRAASHTNKNPIFQHTSLEVAPLRKRQ